MVPESTHIMQAPLPGGMRDGPVGSPLRDVINTSEPRSIDWAGVVSRIQNGENTGTEELYLIFNKGIRFLLCRRIGPQDMDDKVHDTFLLVLQAIQRGDVREPERLMGFIHTIVRRQVAAYIDHMVHSRHEEPDFELLAKWIADRRRNPEQRLVVRQHAAIMKDALLKLPDREREILIRFYVREETQEQICAEMALTETQFRLIKSRAKARFGEIGKRKLKHSVVVLSMRTSA
jgi:RNA polymerase sigma-70 factor (ECF subfamily)